VVWVVWALAGLARWDVGCCARRLGAVVARRARVWAWVERFGRWVGGLWWGLGVAVKKRKY
jgi:hypothetical protein